MALPTNKIKKIKLPNNTEYEIIPSTMQDGTSNYKATLPTLTADSTIALTTYVQANVSSPTASLTSVKIGNTNYSIAASTDVVDMR